MKTWKLDRHQRVSVDHHRTISFQHYIGRHVKEVTLSWRQFLNLNDLILDLDTFQNMKYYPLGKNLWLQYYEKHIQLYHCQLYIYFTFHEASWCKYIKKTHRQILSFLRHGSPALHRRQHAEAHETLFQNQSQNITPTSTQQQVLSRPPSNVNSDTEQRSEYTTLSEWDGSNSRRPFSFIGSVHALGVTPNPASDMEEGEVYDIEHDSGQSSDLYTIE